jgi:hypothetical protein
VATFHFLSVTKYTNQFDSLTGQVEVMDMSNEQKETENRCSRVDVLLARIGGGVAGVHLEHALLRTMLRHKHMLLGCAGLAEKLPQPLLALCFGQPPISITLSCA